MGLWETSTKKVEELDLRSDDEWFTSVPNHTWRTDVVLLDGERQLGQLIRNGGLYEIHRSNIGQKVRFYMSQEKSKSPNF